MESKVRSRPQFRLADILWVMVVVALAVGWLSDRRQLQLDRSELFESNRILRQANADLEYRKVFEPWLLLPYMEQRADAYPWPGSY